MLTNNHRMELLSRAYIEAVAAQCGVSCYYPETDYGIDLLLTQIEVRGRIRRESGVRIEVQAKSVLSDADLSHEFLYDLDARAYDMLRGGTMAMARILILLILPSDECSWTSVGPDGLTIRRGARWLSLAGAPEVGNRRSVRVTFPAVNDFSPASLTGLFRQVRQRRETR